MNKPIQIKYGPPQKQKNIPRNRNIYLEIGEYTSKQKNIPRNKRIYPETEEYT